jgi:NitT/TauT family transport system permease protein
MSARLGPLRALVLRHPSAGSSVLLILIVALWELVLGVITSNDVIPPPSAIVRALADDPSYYWTALLTTAQEAAIGLALGVGFALVLSLLSLISRRVEDNVFSLAVVLNSMPLIVLAPLLVLWFGGGLTPRVTIAALAVFFVVLVNVVRGLKAVSRERRELFTVLGASRTELFWRLQVPSSLPYLLSALKIAAVGSLFGAVIGEWVGANSGLGVVLIFALYQFQTEQLWAAMVLITAVALVFYVVVSLSERIVIPWHESVRKPRLEIER